jgi:predicted unusual protein kinase regulating ubiquinone biosynthesis (AarF/ABC1/UbiB family)
MRDIMPDMMRVAVRHKMRMPRRFVLVTKQLVYLDRYAKAIGGPTMNVLTDPRVLAFLMEDLGRVSGGAGPPPS